MVLHIASDEVGSMCRLRRQRLRRAEDEIASLTLSLMEIEMLIEPLDRGPRMDHC